MDAYTDELIKEIAAKVIRAGWHEISIVITDDEVRCSIYKQYGVIDKIEYPRAKGDIV